MQMNFKKYICLTPLAEVCHFIYLVDIESVSSTLHDTWLLHQLVRPPPFYPILTLGEKQGPKIYGY